MVKRYKAKIAAADTDWPFGMVLQLCNSENGDLTLHSDYAALERRHAELVDAVRWERECIRQLDCAGKFWEDDNIPGRELIKILDAARAAVDTLIGER